MSPLLRFILKSARCNLIMYEQLTHVWLSTTLLAVAYCPKCSSRELKFINYETDFCEHPVIIRNPQLKELLITHRCYTTLSGDHYVSFAQANYFKYRFPDYQFSPRRFKVTLDNIDRFNVFNEKTGEVFPMFIQVPCGKCVLCRDIKAREWSFRATCENVF